MANGTRVYFRCRHKADPALWLKSEKKGKVLPLAIIIRSLPEEVREEIIDIERRIRFHYKRLIREKGLVTAGMIKSACFGNGEPQTLITLFDKHNAEFSKRVGKDRTDAAYKLYLLICRTLLEFIYLKYGCDDIRLQEIDISFINAFDLYLRRDRRLNPSTVHCHVTYLRKIVRLAISSGTLDHDPFSGYRFDTPHPKHKYLTGEELAKILSARIEDPEVCFARDLYVFSCFTGLSHCDMVGLGPEHISHASDGRVWIIKKRDNTDMESKVILLNIPRRIIEKYSGTAPDGRLFDVPNLTILSPLMRTVTKLCGIERSLTFGTARAGFATQIMLKHGVPVETISRMMGYKSAVSARKYINTSLRKIGDDMKVLEKKIGSLYSLQDDTGCNYIGRSRIIKTAQNEAFRSG